MLNIVLLIMGETSEHFVKKHTTHSLPLITLYFLSSLFIFVDCLKLTLVNHGEMDVANGVPVGIGSPANTVDSGTSLDVTSKSTS